jgi:hypothetical protein
MDVPSEKEIREAFEHEIRQMDTFFSLKRNENGDYWHDRIEGAWRGFALGYSVGFRAAHDQSPTFTVTPDARERAQAFQSVNPDYPSPATYLEAE